MIDTLESLRSSSLYYHLRFEVEDEDGMTTIDSHIVKNQKAKFMVEAKKILKMWYDEDLFLDETCVMPISNFYLKTSYKNLDDFYEYEYPFLKNMESFEIETGNKLYYVKITPVYSIILHTGMGTKDYLRQEIMLKIDINSNKME